MKKLHSLVVVLWLCCVGEVSAAPLRLSYSVVGAHRRRRLDGP